MKALKVTAQTQEIFSSEKKSAYEYENCVEVVSMILLPKPEFSGKIQ